MLNFSVDVDKLALNLNALANELRPAVEAGLDAVATRAKQAKDREIGKTYARPVRRLKNGKPAWRRTGDWREGQIIEREPGKRTIRTEGNATKYEPRLANLPAGPDGKNRTNKAAENAAKVIEPQIGPIFENEVANHLKLNR